MNLSWHNQDELDRMTQSIRFLAPGIIHLFDSYTNQQNNI